jgi:hypothetical protein
MNWESTSNSCYDLINFFWVPLMWKERLFFDVQGKSISC